MDLHGAARRLSLSSFNSAKFVRSASKPVKLFTCFILLALSVREALVRGTRLSLRFTVVSRRVLQLVDF